jgi:hypothetical protein
MAADLPFAYEMSVDVGVDQRVGNAGWVARLYSAHIEHDLAEPAERGLSSSKGVQVCGPPERVRSSLRE